MNVVELLKYGRGRIVRGWVKNVAINGLGAVCATGAIFDTQPVAGRRGRLSSKTRNNALSYLDASLPFGTVATVVAWNDVVDRTKKEVLALFDRAITMAKKRKGVPIHPGCRF